MFDFACSILKINLWWVFSCLVSIMLCSYNVAPYIILIRKCTFMILPQINSRGHYRRHNGYIQQNVPFVFMVVFISGMQKERLYLRNYKQCASVRLVLSAALVTNDIKISRRAVGVASGKMHWAPHTYRDYYQSPCRYLQTSEVQQEIRVTASQ